HPLCLKLGKLLITPLNVLCWSCHVLFADAHIKQSLDMSTLNSGSGLPPDSNGLSEKKLPPAASPPAQKITLRLKSLDAYRGFTMLLMALNTGNWLGIAKQFPDSPVWKLLVD